MTAAKKKRSAPKDVRKEPYVRAWMETSKQFSLEGQEKLAYIIFWDCQGDWEKFEEWFQSPKLDNARFHWDPIKQWAEDEEHKEFLEVLYEITLMRYWDLQEMVDA